jgi:hypothetical protein
MRPLTSQPHYGLKFYMMAVAAAGIAFLSCEAQAGDKPSAPFDPTTIKFPDKGTSSGNGTAQTNAARSQPPVRSQTLSGGHKAGRH